MKLYLAPMEGITSYIYRNALEKYFPGTDRYFTPFIAPDQNKILRTKERRDVLPENNRVPDLVPQILTNRAEHFIQTAHMLQEFGYEEVNLNLGCPSAPVVSRKRGSGLLAYPDELNRLLEQIFDGTDIKISVKTRLGKDSTDGVFELMEIYRQYPLSELIIHPRTQKDFYRGRPDRELFGELLDEWKKGASAGSGKEPGANRDRGCPVCYNGDIFTEDDYWRLAQEFPQADAVMLGRGAITDPGLIRRIRTGEKTDRKRLRAFCGEVLEGYREIFGEDRNALFRMKELWVYMAALFPGREKEMKKIRKSSGLAEYNAAVDAVFDGAEYC